MTVLHGLAGLPAGDAANLLILSPIYTRFCNSKPPTKPPLSKAPIEDDDKDDASDDDASSDYDDTSTSIVETAGTSMLTPIKSSIEKKKFVIELSAAECCAFITKRGRGKQCSRKRVGAYCKHHEKSMAKDAMMAKDKALNCEKDATIAKLNRELELATAYAARQATRNFEELALQKMMVEQMDAMMGKLDTLNMSSASK
ncbi:hypothetical protein T492DRAFT_1149197 [Pavlovales sp. CCMP2436]|nr:hypothetical protein T492DRAFT_1149197 [Pavlovales sp. CCMP2436]